MKKIWITLFFAISVSLVYAQQLETITTYFDIFKTKKLEEFTVKQGTFIKHGNYKKWDERGSLIQDYNYANNELHGLSKEFYSESLAALMAASLQQNPEFYYRKLYRQAEYNNGKPKYEKIYKYIKEIQILSKDDLYDNQGEIISSKEYYTNKNPKVTIVREPDNVNYAYTFYYENGKTKEKQCNFIKENQIIQTGKYEAFYESGAKKIIGQYKNGLKDGTFLCYYPDGKVEGEITYKEINGGVIKNSSIEYFNNGKIRYKLNFNDVDENFYAESYDSTTFELSYKSKQPLDYKKGKWIKWYSNGNIFSEREPDGRFTEYYPNGTIKTKGMFDNKEDIKHGDFFYYDNNGLLLEKITYRNGKEEERTSGATIRAQEEEFQKEEKEKNEKDRLALEQKKIETEKVAELKKLNDAKLEEMKVMQNKITENLKLAYSNDITIFNLSKVNGGSNEGLNSKPLYNIFDIASLNDINDVEDASNNPTLFKYYYMNAISLLKSMNLGISGSSKKLQKFHTVPDNVKNYDKIKLWLDYSEKLLKISSNVKQALENKDKKTIKNIEKELSLYKQYIDGQTNLLNMYK